MTPVSNHLPNFARDLLVEAAATPLEAGLKEPDKPRRRAVDYAIDKVKQLYPHFFKEQENVHS
jgi:hypothetical protein